MAKLTYQDKLRLRQMLAYAAQWATMRADYKFCSAIEAGKQIKAFEKTLV